MSDADIGVLEVYKSLSFEVLDRASGLFMAETETSADPIFDASKSEDKKEEESGEAPVFRNKDLGLAAWINEDVNGNFYISVKINLLNRSVNLFVPDELKEDFNKFAEHIKEKRS